MISASEDVKCYCSLLADFKNRDKNVKTFLKGKQILLLLRKFYRKIKGKSIISYSIKMQPLLAKCFKSVGSQQAIPAGSLKMREPSKNTQKQVKSSNRS